MKPSVNVGTSERWISVLIGGSIIFYTSRKYNWKDWRAWLASLLAAECIRRGITGRSYLHNALKNSKKTSAPEPQFSKTNGFLITYHSVTVARPREELFDYWRGNMESISPIDTGESNWPINQDIIEEVKNERISWQSSGSAPFQVSGCVSFSPVQGGQSTEVKQTMKYRLPNSNYGPTIAQALGHDPGHQLRTNLRRFKELMESGIGRIAA